ncbi:MAG: hypothetical protein AB9856_05905 [Cellulosilyticaceae bacterium]
MCAYVNKWIRGCCIARCKIINLNIELPSEKYVLIQGSVCTAGGVPLANAAIAVFKMSRTCPLQEIYIGMTFTLEDGSYGISVPRGSDYKLVCYP